MKTNSKIYDRCLALAKQTGCKKMGWGCVATIGGYELVGISNRPVHGLESWCEPDCIRKQIQSRTESMVGACGHAEEQAVWELVRMGFTPSAVDFYVAGVTMDGEPILKTTPDYTCIRCATCMAYAGVKGVYVPGVEDWYFIPIDDMVRQAKQYAAGEKVVPTTKGW